MARYSRPESLRQALEDRLKARARDTSLPLDRLRKEAAFQRLLARIAATAPEGSWALKGGMAMIARVSSRARATIDIDAS
ncbi:MAG: nucleotidyl transferase AbiEii/AbiGii toxin family protein [Dehalococcoidia bacterium]|nr:nucleotidyl transferase AbiEii/AbiGii toxin family protein [Dehalococcoidia bacterium]